MLLEKFEIAYPLKNIEKLLTQNSSETHQPLKIFSDDGDDGSDDEEGKVTSSQYLVPALLPKVRANFCEFSANFF